MTVSRNGVHEVLFINGIRRFIPADEWISFLQRQRILMSCRTPAAIKCRPLVTAKVRLPSGVLVNDFDAAWSINQRLECPGSSESQSYGGSKLLPTSLKFYSYCPGKGTLSLLLQLGSWTSQTVTVDVASIGQAKPVEVIFNMK